MFCAPTLHPLVTEIKSGVELNKGQLAQVFPYHPLWDQSNCIYFLFYMLSPNIAKCYSELLEDTSLLWLFSEQECTSLQELPLLGALCFRLILESFFTHIASPDIWGKTGVEFITDTSLRISGEATSMTILITDGVGKENLGMVMSSAIMTKTK